MFVLFLNHGWFGKLEGTVQDDPVSGMPDEGEVDGNLTGNQLSFVKRMPVDYVSADDELISYREYFLRQTGKDLGYDPPHPPILYRGTVSADGNQMEGTWEIIQNGKTTRTGVWQAARTR